MAARGGANQAWAGTEGWPSDRTKGLDLRTTLALGKCQRGNDTIGDADRVAENVRLPKTKNDPPQRFEHFRLLAVALKVAPNLGNPIGGVVPGSEPSQSSVNVAPVPEISVTKDGHSVLWKDDIGPPWQVGHMKVVA